LKNIYGLEGAFMVSCGCIVIHYWLILGWVVAVGDLKSIECFLPPSLQQLSFRPFVFTLPGCLSRSASSALWRRGWQALFGASQMHGFPAVCGCGMVVVFVSCRRQLKYIIYEILHRKDRKRRKASAVESFAVFAPFAVRYQ